MRHSDRRVFSIQTRCGVGVRRKSPGDARACAQRVHAAELRGLEAGPDEGSRLIC